MQLPKRRNQFQTSEHEDAVVYLTAEGIRRLDSQIRKLKEVDGPIAIQDVSDAVQKGDLSENAEYQEARARLTRIQNSVVRLEDRRKRVVLVEGKDSEVVQVGSTVTIQAVKDGSARTYEIVGPSETDPSRGRISYLSPIGSALLRHAVGDLITLSLRGEGVEFHVTNIV